MQTTRDLIDRLHIDRVLRILCGWRYTKDIPSESKFSRVFKELSDLSIAQKTHFFNEEKSTSTQTVWVGWLNLQVAPNLSYAASFS